MNSLARLWASYQYRRSSIRPFQYLKFLKKSQWCERDRLDKLQLEQWKKLIRYAAEKTPYYKDLLNGLNTDTFTFDDIRTLPILTKEILRGRTEDLRSVNRSLDVIEAVTSGSTGSPVKIFRSREASAIHLAGHYRFHSWWGVKPGDRHVLIWGSQKKGEKKRTFKKKLKDKLVISPLVIDVFDLNEDTIKDYIHSIVLFNPVYIRGYVSAIKHLYQLVKENNIDISHLKPKIIINTSEVLYQHDRKFIEEISGARVANEYGSRDGGQFAYECPDGGLHIQEEYQFIWADQNQELIGTELNNLAMPLINYRVGDRVIISDDLCSCGRNLRIIESVEGKARDMVIKPDGSQISSRIFFEILKELDILGHGTNIKQFQVVQKDNYFYFQIVKDKNFSQKAVSYIEEKMKEKIGRSIEISFNFPQTINREQSGKMRYFIRLS